MRVNRSRHKVRKVNSWDVAVLADAKGRVASEKKVRELLPGTIRSTGARHGDIITQALG